MSSLRNIGVELAKQGRYDAALFLLKKATIKGDLNALNDAGVTYERTGDYKQAYKCYQRCAKSKLPTAIRNLGNMYENGLGVEKNYKKAIKYYKEAAILGNSDSYYKLSRFFEEGLGVRKNYKIAVRLAKQGALIEVDKKEETANLITLGYYYENGIGVEQDKKKAFSFYQKANEIGGPVAKYCVGHCYHKGIGVEQNIQLAIMYLSDNGLHGDADSCLDMSEIYDSNEYNMKDDDLCKFWLAEGANNGSIKAQILIMGKMLAQNEIKIATEMACEINKNRSDFKPYEEECYKATKEKYINIIDWESIELEPFTYLKEDVVLN